MNILILSKYESKGASSRYRFYQYVPFLKNENWQIDVKPLLSNKYIDYLYEKKNLPLFEIFISYCKRFIVLLTARKYDLIWFEQEMFPWIPFFVEKFLLKRKTKLVADYDDAFFHRYDLHNYKIIRLLFGKKIDRVMAMVDLVLAGNDYIASRAKINNPKHLLIFPTVVDTEKFVNKKNDGNKIFTIGWIGTPGTSKYLLLIEEALEKIYNEGDVKFSFIGTGVINFKNIVFENIQWNELTEVEEISKFNIGIMPLPDNPWEKGKCGFKLIQYLSCGIPVIGSPVGVNNLIIQDGVNGFKADSIEKWIKYFLILKRDNNLRIKMGQSGRDFIINNYSLQNNSKKLIELFKDITRK